MPVASAEEVLAFWFAPEQDGRWFQRDGEFDAEIRQRFLVTYEAAYAGELDPWREAPRSLLALIIVLDQFARNMFRASPRAFAADSRAIQITRDGIEKGFDRGLSSEEQDFLYMPLMHSEKLADHDLYARLRGDSSYGREHREIISRFGRFPHRNAVLGRPNTEAEDFYLRETPPSFSL
jgi:uncharacterized protein (DUF924 family)